jgi:hypothetical protein
MARKNPKLDKIYEIFDKHGVEIERDSIWEVQGTPVVKHKDVERLGAKLNVTWEKPQVLRAERDEAVIMVIGKMGDKLEWSIGEALIVREGEIGGNYKVKGKMAAYPYAMAEKRAKDRVILKLADLHGDVYSEDEADDFSDRNQRDDRQRSSNDNRRNDDPADDDKSAREASVSKEEGQKIVLYWEGEIEKCEKVRQVMELAGDKKFLEDLKVLSSKGEAHLKKLVNDRAQFLKRGADAA